jgi:hypothetical protein
MRVTVFVTIQSFTPLQVLKHGLFRTPISPHPSPGAKRDRCAKGSRHGEARADSPGKRSRFID